MLQKSGDDSAAHRLTGQDNLLGAMQERPLHCSMEITPFSLPISEISRRVAGNAEVISIGYRESRETHIVHDFHDAQQVLAGTVLPVHPDDESATPVREVPRGQRS